MKPQTPAFTRRLAASVMLGSALSVAGSPQAVAQDDVELERINKRLNELEQELSGHQDSRYALGPYINKMGGRFQFDQTFRADADPALEDALTEGDKLEQGAEFRRVWFFVEGRLAPWLDYKLQLDFAGGVSARDIYIEAHDLGGFPSVRIGNFKEPLSLQEQTSSKYISLMSRSMLADEVGSQGYSNGIMLSDSFLSGRLNVAAGAFNPDFSNSSFDTGDGDTDAWALSTRLTSPVLYENGGERVLHIGGFFSHRSVDSFTLGQEPEVHKTDDFMGGRVDNLNNRRILGVEFASVYRSAHIQTEYVRSTLDASTGFDPDIDTYYIQGGVFITGERRPYNKSSGSFGRVNPNQPFMGSGNGAGAWEFVVRYSELDAEEMADAVSFSGALPGAASTSGANVAETSVATAGLNWYPVSHAKWMLNYVYADQDTLGEASYLTSRFQVDF